MDVSQWLHITADSLCPHGHLAKLNELSYCATYLCINVLPLELLQHSLDCFQV